ncbi:DUF5610 domain-containing protein [Gilvimarinus agarilyticus]|uniref:DUF5610 domain-containing protein n=1 Tax=Gilvimarinus agarilyticus TaxID=679259 RepID=UPI0005A01BFB|nr:DUF5610 domain-containing protein [Gilvimarinus agarilyticus]
MTPHQTGLHSTLSATRQAAQLSAPDGVVNSKTTQALTLLGDKAAEHIQPAETGHFKPLTAEQAAGNILGFIQRQLERDAANGATGEALEARLQAGLSGFNKGFEEARERLEALSLLDKQVSSAINKTYELVTTGIDELAHEFLGYPLAETEAVTAPTRPVTPPNHASYQYASAQSFRFELLTAEGDKVSIQANASHSDLQFWRDADGSGSRASSSSLDYQLNITGELNEAEQTAINNLVQQVNSLAESFFSGDIAGAFESALALGYDQAQIEGFALNLTRVDIQRANSAYGSQAPASSQLQERLQPVGQFIKDTQNAVAQANQFAEPYQLLLDIVNGLYADADLPGNRDGKRFSDFLDKVLANSFSGNTNSEPQIS